MAAFPKWWVVTGPRKQNVREWWGRGARNGSCYVFVFSFFLNETIVTIELIIQLAETKDTWNPRHNYKIYRLIF